MGVPPGGKWREAGFSPVNGYSARKPKRKVILPIRWVQSVVTPDIQLGVLFGFLVPPDYLSVRIGVLTVHLQCAN